MTTLTLLLATSASLPAAPVPAHIAIRQEIDLAIKNFTSNSPEVRKKAEETLLRHLDRVRQRLEELRKDPDHQVARQANLVMVELRKHFWAQADVHVAGLYTARQNPAVVKVEPTGKPIVLVLCAYDPVTWHVQVEPNAHVVRVIVSGYNEQHVQGVDPSLVETYTHKGTCPGEGRKYFYAYQPKGGSYSRLTEEVKRMTGKDINSFQGSYEYSSPFRVGGPK